MTQNLGIDTTVDVTPYLDCLRGSGVTFVCRYVNPIWVSRGLTREEGLSISNAGLSIVALYEWGAASYSASYFTRHHGQLDAERAFARAQQVGIPGGKPIYFAVDMYVDQQDLQAVDDYFDGVGEELRALGRSGPTYAVGAYGGYLTVAHLRETGRARYVFQTYAWSQGRIVQDVNLYQEQNDVWICGFPNDRDISHGDGGGFKIE